MVIGEKWAFKLDAKANTGMIYGSADAMKMSDLTIKAVRCEKPSSKAEAHMNTCEDYAMMIGDGLDCQVEIYFREKGSTYLVASAKKSTAKTSTAT